jgi:hypothetical protein
MELLCLFQRPFQRSTQGGQEEFCWRGLKGVCRPIIQSRCAGVEQLLQAPSTKTLSPASSSGVVRESVRFSPPSAMVPKPNSSPCPLEISRERTWIAILIWHLTLPLLSFLSDVWPHNYYSVRAGFTSWLI